ncbi:hypothetical protein DL767_009944 [Monosporascus sp. MG133]|nr:hypothetical protein DL767_009944 [Monosporascus sp. MG133]
MLSTTGILPWARTASPYGWDTGTVLILTLSLDTRCIWIRNYHYHYSSVVLDHSSPYDDHGLHKRSYAHTTRGRLRL